MSTVETTESTGHGRLTPWMLGIAGVTFLVGLLFGYDQGVISGAIEADLAEEERDGQASWSELFSPHCAGR